jgi:D-lyxose ketol-isomerase
MVLGGTLLLEIGEGENIEKHKLKRGENFHVTPGLVHRFCAPYGDVEIVEVSTPHLDDVVRLEDDYKREE